jgi:Phage tail tube protein
MNGATNILAIEMTPEAEFGVAQGASPDKRYDFTGARPRVRTEQRTNADRHTGIYERTSSRTVARQWVEAGYEFDLRLDTFAAIFGMAMGQLITTGDVGAYSHEVLNRQGDLLSRTLFWRDAATPEGKIEAFPGMKVRSAELTIGTTGNASIAAEFIGKGAETDTGSELVTGTMPARNTDPNLILAHVSSVTLGGVELKRDLLDFSLRVENPYAEGDEFSAGGIYLPSLERLAGVGFTGRMTLKRRGNEQLAKAVAATPEPLVLTLTEAAGKDLVIELPKLVLLDPNIDGGKGKEKLPLTFEADFDHVTSRAIRAVVRNDVASYV